MADTFTFEDAQKASDDSFSFEEVSGQDATGNTAANLVKSIAQPANIAVGDILKGLAIQPMSMQQGIGIPDASKIADLFSGAVTKSPTYQAGEFISETGRQMDTGKPALTKKVAEMGGGFLPIIAS